MWTCVQLKEVGRQESLGGNPSSGEGRMTERTHGNSEAVLETHSWPPITDKDRHPPVLTVTWPFLKEPTDSPGTKSLLPRPEGGNPTDALSLSLHSKI